ncbi:MAG TPA: transcription antitermination factor NusB [Acidimicrobiales bacterium]|nr:transcription antitermination factor NusB [Acidimicrobiales bacterium]
MTKSEDPRRVALAALEELDTGAYLNLSLPARLSRSSMTDRDRRFVTHLVYGTARMKRACDWLVDRFLVRDVEPSVRATLRLGAYQLVYLGTPAHAAVSATVEVAPSKAKGLVNAVLRRVAADLPPAWPDDATRLSYPDWIIERLRADLGEVDALAALEAMNVPAEVTTRADGYVQDLASQWVAGLVGAQAGERVLDLCAAPGGKATLLAQTGAQVVASEVSLVRSRLVGENARTTASALSIVTADGRRSPFRPSSFDRVLVDAPCSGLGVLRRRPDARWRKAESDLTGLVSLQRELIGAALELVRPGGTVVYSVCTVTRAETVDIDAWVRAEHPGLEVVEPPVAPWRPWGSGAILLPQDAGTDGMWVTGYISPRR